MSQQQFLNILINLLAYSDSGQTNDPKLRDIDYYRQFIGVGTANSFGQKLQIPANSSFTVANTARILSQDATTQYTVYLYSGSIYRWKYAGGTNPILKTKRNVPYNALTQYDVSKVGDIVRYTWNGVGTNPDFIANGVVAGDIVFIEANGNFNALNTGTFTIVKVAASYIEIVNDSGVAETAIALGALISGIWTPIQFFASDGIQDGDEVNITSSAFSIENRGIFTITKSTAEFFEIANGNPGIPEGPFAIGISDALVFYGSIYKWLYIESDQKISVRVNGATDDKVQIEPIIAANINKVGVYLQRGGIWRLTLANNNNTSANIKVALLE